MGLVKGGEGVLIKGNVSENSWGSKFGLLGEQWEDIETRKWSEAVGSLISES